MMRPVPARSPQSAQPRIWRHPGVLVPTETFALPKTPARSKAETVVPALGVRSQGRRLPAGAPAALALLAQTLVALELCGPNNAVHYTQGGIHYVGEGLHYVHGGYVVREAASLPFASQGNTP